MQVNSYEVEIKRLQSEKHKAECEVKQWKKLLKAAQDKNIAETQEWNAKLKAAQDEVAMAKQHVQQVTLDNQELQTEIQKQKEELTRLRNPEEER